MVARTPPKQRRTVAVAPLNPVLIRETVQKVDKCMARLQELQYTVAGGNKVIAGVSLSPRSTRGYLRTSLRCKQESLRIKNAAGAAHGKSPVGKFPASSKGGEWRKMSLPAMLVGETVGEILQASQFAREMVASVSSGKTMNITPVTPITQRRKPRPQPEIKSKRKKEKQNNRSESCSPSLQRARSRIIFKVSPPRKTEVDKDNIQYRTNKVSPRNKPWAKKAVLFPNPLFLSSTHSAHLQKFCKTKSPMLAKNRQATTPHKFLIKSPPSATKFQVKIKTLSPRRPINLSKESPKLPIASKLRRSFSPSRLANRLVSPLKTRNLISPLKSRKFGQKSDGLMSGLKQRP
ncbi:hypothetical protein K2173_022196 [Erythroxylum novogranatense]|uniref:Microtubule-binding protein TANGLED n=1 Tax=Erythroxylum novogranatense TaxID=1862640 RepID=A0AAV8STI5_9ROSI|nr:hypothetical protein K2173_022196 [Erythroxylum novogranatense]